MKITYISSTKKHPAMTCLGLQIPTQPRFSILSCCFFSFFCYSVAPNDMSPSLSFLLLGCLLVSASWAQEVQVGAAPSAKYSNFGGAFSTEFLAYVLNKIVPPVTDAALTALGPALPQDCCYGSKSHERLYLSNMAIPSDSIASSVSVSEGKEGPKVTLYVDFDVTLTYKLCKPGSLGTCQEMFPCGGDATLGIRTDTHFDVVVAAGKNGNLEVSFKKFHFHLDVKKHGICFLLQGLLDSAMPFINIFLNALLPNVLGPVIHDIKLPHNITLPGPVPLGVDWSLTQGTGSNKYGLSAQGILDIIVGSTKAPYLPNYPLPIASNLIKDEVVTLEATDSLINNVLFAVSEHFKDFEFDTKQNGFKIKLNFPHAPYVNFTSATGNQAAVITLFTHVSLTKLPLKIAVTSVETAHLALLFNSHGQLYLTLDPNDFVVDITSMTPPQPNATKNKIEAEIESFWSSFIPGVNEMLAAHPIAIPAPPGAHSPQIDYHNGYAQIIFKTDRKKGEEEQQQEFVDIVDPAEIDPANVFDVEGGLQQAYGDALSPAISDILKLVWESAMNVPEDEVLSLANNGYPKGRALSCPNIPKFSNC